MKDPLVSLSDVFEVILKIDRNEPGATADTLIVHLLKAFSGPLPTMPPKPPILETSDDFH